MVIASWKRGLHNVLTLHSISVKILYPWFMSCSVSSNQTRTCIAFPSLHQWKISSIFNRNLNEYKALPHYDVINKLFVDRMIYFCFLLTVSSFYPVRANNWTVARISSKPMCYNWTISAKTKLKFAKNKVDKVFRAMPYFSMCSFAWPCRDIVMLKKTWNTFHRWRYYQYLNISDSIGHFSAVSEQFNLVLHPRLIHLSRNIIITVSIKKRVRV